ncbi:MAG: VRR-NUC domain-containing protein [Candidatus Eisenbacteria sp.]|nr:VRR-NUC domain-containing protein [Candidatus Eisenbacteria bacterium]
MNRPTHKTAIEAIRRLVSALGGVCNVLPQSSRGSLHGSAGISDLYLQMQDQSVWVEVKVGKDKLSPAQVAFIAREHACGGAVLVGDVDTVIEFLGIEGRGVKP